MTETVCFYTELRILFFENGLLEQVLTQCKYVYIEKDIILFKKVGFFPSTKHNFLITHFLPSFWFLSIFHHL